MVSFVVITAPLLFLHYRTIPDLGGGGGVIFFYDAIDDDDVDDNDGGGDDKVKDTRTIYSDCK